MQRDPVKIIFAAIFTIYFLWCDWTVNDGNFMHNVHLPIHEAGHLFFHPLGEFMTVAGGSLFQVIVPLVFFGYFVWHEKFFSASVVLFWVGSSILDVYIYANDAVVMQLVLTSGFTGSEGSFHDWNYLLTEMNLLDKTPLIAKMIRFTGTIITFAAIAGSFILARKDEQLISDFER